MERSPVRDIEIKHVLKEALTDEIHNRDIYMKGIDTSYYYEGHSDTREDLGWKQENYWRFCILQSA